MVKKMVLEYKYGKMEVNIKEILYKMKEQGGVFFIMLMEIFIEVNLKKVLQMVMENIFMKMELYIMVIG